MDAEKKTKKNEKADVKKESDETPERKPMVALKDYFLNCPPHIQLNIKKGEDLESKGIPAFLINGLKTEKVI